MLPLRDNIPSQTTPFVNYTVIALCTFVFIQQATGPEDQSSLIERYGMVPARVAAGDVPLVFRDVETIQTPQGPRRILVERPMASSAVPGWLTMLTCTFLHGGLLHFAGNMWFLWIFGDNVEDRYGHIGYLIFYLGCGVAASFAHYLVNRDSAMPTIGASGAIAGVMGAYLLLYPHARVLTLVPIIVIYQLFSVPAPVFLGLWFLMQFYQGAQSASASGVAWWAHIGGFLAGLAVTWWLEDHRHLRPRVDRIRPGTDRIVSHTWRPGSRSPWR